MEKCMIIASCLTNSNMIRNLEDAEQTVKKIFLDEFPMMDNNKWNTHIDDVIAQTIIKKVGRASQINVKQFILDLEEI